MDALIASDRADQDDILEAVFDEDYLCVHDPMVGAARTDREAALVVSLLEPAAGSCLLDLCCGHGRIANRLAQLGFRMHGIDRSPVFIARATADARARGVGVDLRLGDAAALPYGDATFDGIFCWFTSFGLGDDAKCRQILAEARRVMKPGARLALDLVNPFFITIGFQIWGAQEGGGRTMLDRHQFDAMTGRLWIERRFFGGDRPERRMRFFLRQWTVPEIRDWLLAAGFATVTAVDGAGHPFEAGAPQLIVVATA